MSFTESNTVEQMILDAMSRRGGCGGALGWREGAPGWGASLGMKLCTRNKGVTT